MPMPSPEPQVEGVSELEFLGEDEDAGYAGFKGRGRRG